MAQHAPQPLDGSVKIIPTAARPPQVGGGGGGGGGWTAAQSAQSVPGEHHEVIDWGPPSWQKPLLARLTDVAVGPTIMVQVLSQGGGGGGAGQHWL